MHAGKLRNPADPALPLCLSLSCCAAGLGQVQRPHAGRLLQPHLRQVWFRHWRPAASPWLSQPTCCGLPPAAAASAAAAAQPVPCPHRRQPRNPRFGVPAGGPAPVRPALPRRRRRHPAATSCGALSGQPGSGRGVHGHPAARLQRYVHRAQGPGRLQQLNHHLSQLLRAHLWALQRSRCAAPGAGRLWAAQRHCSAGRAQAAAGLDAQQRGACPAPHAPLPGPGGSGQAAAEAAEEGALSLTAGCTRQAALHMEWCPHFPSLLLVSRPPGFYLELPHAFGAAGVFIS